MWIYELKEVACGLVLQPGGCILSSATLNSGSSDGGHLPLHSSVLLLVSHCMEHSESALTLLCD